jgi:hypothetical protein
VNRLFELHVKFILFSPAMIILASIFSILRTIGKGLKKLSRILFWNILLRNRNSNQFLRKNIYSFINGHGFEVRQRRINLILLSKAISIIF